MIIRILIYEYSTIYSGVLHLNEIIHDIKEY